MTIVITPVSLFSMFLLMLMLALSKISKAAVPEADSLASTSTSISSPTSLVPRNRSGSSIILPSLSLLLLLSLISSIGVNAGGGRDSCTSAAAPIGSIHKIEKADIDNNDDDDGDADDDVSFFIKNLLFLSLLYLNSCCSRLIVAFFNTIFRSYFSFRTLVGETFPRDDGDEDDEHDSIRVNDPIILENIPLLLFESSYFFIPVTSILRSNTLQELVAGLLSLLLLLLSMVVVQSLPPSPPPLSPLVSSLPLLPPPPPLLERSTVLLIIGILKSSLT